LRQPFGGMGKSAVGPGIKAGGPNYVATLMQFEDRCDLTDPLVDIGDTGLDDFCEALRSVAQSHALDDAEVESIVRAAQSYEHWMQLEFSQAHDSFRLIGEDNFRRYLPLGEVHVRVHSHDSLFEIFARALAARTAGCRTVISTQPGVDANLVKQLDELTDSWAAAIEFVAETDTELAAAIDVRPVRIRYAAPERVPLELRAAAASAGRYLADTRVSAHGRIELMWYFQEQSLTQIYHRYGNLGRRAEEERALVC
jgi:RHH-type proline utilization regulon transcriptional repressor/proline dehydrogenase/delta 1-pyrroline-5-carboxylate dehydrogenase